SKDLNDLQALLAKPVSKMVQKDRDEMLRLEAEVSDFEKAKAEDEAVVEAMVAAFGGAPDEGRRQFLSQAKGHKEWIVRAIGARVAAVAPDDDLSKALIADALAPNQDARVKCIALEALEKAPGKVA